MSIPAALPGPACRLSVDTRIACLPCLVRWPVSAEGTWGSALVQAVLSRPACWLSVDTALACLPCPCRQAAASEGTWGSARLLLPWLKHRGKHSLNDGLTRRSGQRYPGRGVSSPWIPVVPVCRARFAGQAPQKGHGSLPVPCDHG